MNNASIVFLALMAISGARAATVDQVIVRQQWPWSTDIKVEYRLSGVTTPVDVSVTCYNGDTELAALPLGAATGDLYGIKDRCVGSICIDPVKAFGDSKVAIPDFRVKLSLSASAANLNDVLYKIFCLTNNMCIDVTRADLLNGVYGSIVTNFSSIGEGFTSSVDDVLIWTGVTNNAMYKTTHLVMRRIPAENVVWRSGSSGETAGRTMGAMANPTQYYIKLSSDFYIGVFELTQAQYKYIYGSNPSYYNDIVDADVHPVERITVYEVRGNPRGILGNNPLGILTNEAINWPTNSYPHDVASNTLLGKLRDAVKWEFDLPTDAQWEFACRAGTSTAFNNGVGGSGNGSTEANATTVGWVADNTPEKTSHEVGLKPCNALGLYDMHGNVMEMTLCAYSEMNAGAKSGTGVNEDDPAIDPVGTSEVSNYDGVTRTKRGGSYGYNEADSSVSLAWGDSRSATRIGWYSWSGRRSDMGIRLVCPVQKQWAPHD